MTKNRFETGDKVLVMPRPDGGEVFPRAGYVAREGRNIGRSPHWEDGTTYDVRLANHGWSINCLAERLRPHPQTYPDPIIYCRANHLGLCRIEYRTHGSCQITHGVEFPRDTSLLEKARYEAESLACYYERNVRPFVSEERYGCRAYWLAIPKGFCFEYVRVEI